MRKQTVKWTCKDGSKIRVCDMSDSHLINTIKFLERQHERQVLSTPYPMFNGEMAQLYADMEFDNLIQSDVSDLYPIYDNLLFEAERRGLNAHS